jgi:hypothetical protein
MPVSFSAEVIDLTDDSSEVIDLTNDSDGSQTAPEDKFD